MATYNLTRDRLIVTIGLDSEYERIASENEFVAALTIILNFTSPSIMSNDDVRAALDRALSMYNMYNPFDDKELIKMIGEALAKLDPDPEFDKEPWLDEDLTWCLRFGDLEELTEDTVCVDYRIMDSVAWDGSNHVDVSPIPPYEVEGGYNIGWCASTPGGRILANYYPYNYTGQVWTLDKEEAWARAEWALEVLEEWLRSKNLLEE